MIRKNGLKTMEMCLLPMSRNKKETFEFQGYTVLLEQKKMKNMYLRVKDDGVLYVTAPLSFSRDRIEKFLVEKEDWIKEHVAKKQLKKEWEESIRYVTGDTVFFWGEEYPLEVISYGARSKVTFDGQVIRMTVPDGATKEMREKALLYFYRKQLEPAIERAFLRFEPVVGKQHTGVTIRDMKTRWGSCNVRTGQISLNLKLATKLPECLDYVVVHELTHLWEANHGKRFYARMDLYYPGWKQIRKLLND